MAAVADRPLAPLPSSSSSSSFNFISRTSPRILRSRPSNHPIPSKPPFLSKPSKNPIPSRPPEPSKDPILFKRSKPKTVTRSHKPSMIPTSVSGRISFLKTPKPPESNLLPRWNSSTKVDYDSKGNLRLQRRPRLPTPGPPINSQKLHFSKPTKDHRIPIPNDMPPLEVCASPEIVKETLEAPKTICFTAGHLIDRGEDGTRGRPRGLLTVGGPMTEVIEETEGLPPLMKASMRWFSPPSASRSSSINNSSHSRIRTVLFRDDDSVKPPRDEERSCPSHVKPPRDEERSCPSPVSETPESLYSGSQFPTNGSNTSPFTLILKRAAAGHWGFLSPSSVMRQNGDDMADKEAKLKEKELIMKTAKDKHNAEQEKKRLDPEFHREMLQTEEEVKRLQDEALREEKCREKEKVERKKQLKKQQEEAEKDQCNQETEESELRKLLKKQQEEAEKNQYYQETEESELRKLVKKQQEEAEKDQCYQETEESELRKLLNKQQEDAEREHPPSEKEEAVMKKQTALQKQETPVLNPSRKHDDTINTTTSLMGNDFSQMGVQTKKDLFKLHVAGWLKLNKSNRSSRWGVRRNSNIEVVKESKLQGTSTEADTPGKVATPNEGLTHNKAIHKKLIQFDNSPRPTYYGTWCKESSVGWLRYHLKKDPNFDCDVVSDEEWEEKEPGENLSDCDKDDEKDQLDEACHSKIDDKVERESGFFLPDGYVSENVGCNRNDMEEDAKSSQSCKQYMFSHEFRLLMRQQKCLNNLIEQALRKNQTLVILCLIHDKSEQSSHIADPGKLKFEQACLQALCMRACPGPTSVMDVPTIDNTSKEVFQSQKKTTTYGDSPAAISKSDMSKFIWFIRECSQGIMLEGQEVL